MELVFVRHAIPVRRELESGIADPELSPAGREQARLLGEYLASESIDAIYASPLRRARETAEAIASHHGVDIVIDHGLSEYDRSSNEYVPVEELKAADDPRWHDIRNGVWNSSDESEDEFVERVVRSAERIVSEHSGQRVLAVCHGGVINAYLAQVLGVPNRRGFFYPNYTSIHRVAAARSGERSIVTVNETPHLRGSGLPIGLFQK
jgi:broad specificity phosphatase PhoE